MRRALAALTCFLVGTTSCERVGDTRPQWLVRVSTDAPIPSLGDRIMVDVLDSNGKPCGDCRRTFEVTEPSALPLSFGIENGGGDPPALRIRLYRSRHLDESGEPGEPTIDLVARLPNGNDGISEVDAVLATRCFGQRADLDTMSGCAPGSGEHAEAMVLEGSTVGSLPMPNTFGGGDVPCEGEPPEGMVCIPGGVFLMGSLEHGSLGPSVDPVPEQLVRLRPYFIDADEFTLDDLAAAGPSAPHPILSSDAEPFCTYAPGATGTRPVNCLSREQSQRICELEGKRLPTEAEWEFAAANRTLDTVYPWTDGDASNESVCARASIARGGLQEPGHSRECLLLDSSLSKGTSESSEGDVTELGVRRMGGSVSEWVSDDFTPYSNKACWGDDYGLREPAYCNIEGAPVVYRGGSFSDNLYYARVFLRRSDKIGIKSASIGFRCVMTAEGNLP